MPLPEAAFSAFSPVLFYPLAAEPHEVALARFELVQFVPPDKAFRLVPRDLIWLDL